MTQTLTKLQNQALVGILDSSHISKRVGGNLTRFVGLMGLSMAMLAASGHADARSNTGNKISAVLAGGAALMYMGNSNANNPQALDGAKIVGGAALGSVVGSQMGNGGGGAALVGAVVGGALVNGALTQNRNAQNNYPQNMGNMNGSNYDPRYQGPPPGAPYSRYPANHVGPFENGVYNGGYGNNNARQPSSLIMYQVQGQQGFFVSVDNSPSIGQMRSGQMNGMPLGQNPQLANDLNQKFQRYAQSYQELEQANQQYEAQTMQRNNNANYYQTNYQQYGNNYNRAQDIQYSAQNLERAADVYGRARGEFFLSADNAVFAGYGVAHYREALNMLQPSPRVNVSLQGNNKYPVINQNRANFIIR